MGEGELLDEATHFKFVSHSDSLTISLSPPREHMPTCTLEIPNCLRTHH